MTWSVPPGSVVDTTADTRWAPLRVTARMAEPVAGLPRDPMHLDGPASWAAYQAALTGGMREPPPMREYAHDWVMPFATWTGPCTRPDPDPRLLAADGSSVWGWACSAASYTAARHTVAHVRRKPELGMMARLTEAKSHHIGHGPRRAANVSHQAVWTPEITWWCLASPDPLRTLLAGLPAVGRLTNAGWGRVLSWDVEVDEAARERWRWREMPDPAGTPGSVRAPYHHESRRMLTRKPGPAPWV